MLSFSVSKFKESNELLENKNKIEEELANSKKGEHEERSNQTSEKAGQHEVDVEHEVQKEKELKNFMKLKLEKTIQIRQK